MGTKRDDEFNRIDAELHTIEDYVVELEGKIAKFEEEKKHYARQLGAANVEMKKLKEQITELESTISGYEAVMKAKENIHGK